MERTLIMIKPDGIKRKLIGSVVKEFEDKGYEIKGLKIQILSKCQIEKHYAEHIGKSYYPDLYKYVSSGPVVQMVVEKENCIKEARELCGNTDPRLAVKNTIREKYGINKTQNFIHSSDSVENANREISLYFADYELV